MSTRDDKPAPAIASEPSLSAVDDASLAGDESRVEADEDLANDELDDAAKSVTLFFFRPDRMRSHAVSPPQAGSDKSEH